jgi:hypothetical protein
MRGSAGVIGKLEFVDATPGCSWVFPLFRRGGDWMTFVVADDKAHLRKMEIAHNNGLAAEVFSGLAEGEAVTVYPPDSVTDGGFGRGCQKRRVMVLILPPPILIFRCPFTIEQLC